MTTKLVFPQDTLDPVHGLVRAGGIDLLEYYVGCALNGLLASWPAESKPVRRLEELTDTAVRIAEATIEGLEKRRKQNAGH